MTSQEIEQLTKDIIAGIESAADMASVLAPGLAPLILLGKALDKAVPGLAGMVNSWIEGNPPEPHEIEELKSKLAVLADPNNP